ncbi:cobalt transporter CbiM [Gorillibacterium timonense]|uniref:cobalt transporter CbiM n=1 Tax=Gorillibacterium timonense TaxID=1689269 RepID=UPI00071DEBB2|nr:cobalt transporter CbiM [Gorillibacterium timonense]
MHIPDHYLSPSTCAVLAAAMLPVWGWAGGRVKRELSRKKIPYIGVGAAFSFLIMMVNLPLPGGTSGHAVGAALAAILWGPAFAVISTSVALAIQALVFGDGGILAFGANCFNMAFAMPLIAYGLFKLIGGRNAGPKRKSIAAFIAGYVSLNAAAFLTSLEFGIQPLLFTDKAGLPLYGPYGLDVAIPAMMIPHLLVIGIVEGLVTAGVYRYVSKASPDFLYEGSRKSLKTAYLYLGGLLALTPLGLLAAGTAWGEWGTDEIRSLLGFIPQGMKSGMNWRAPFTDYSLTGIHQIAGYLMSGVIGVLLIGLMIWLAGKLSTAKTDESRE